jgi:hypothetical protein
VGALSELSPLLAHGGIPGLIGETLGPLLILGVFGLFLRRSVRREREREKQANRSGEAGE